MKITNFVAAGLAAIFCIAFLSDASAQSPRRIYSVGYFLGDDSCGFERVKEEVEEIYQIQQQRNGTFALSKSSGGRALVTFSKRGFSASLSGQRGTVFVKEKIKVKLRGRRGEAVWSIRYISAGQACVQKYYGDVLRVE